MDTHNDATKPACPANETGTACSQRPSKAAMIAGWVLTLLPMPLFLLSATFKFTQPKEFTEGMTKFGFDPSIGVPLGIVELTCVALYLFPRTAVLGAILLTGYLGGAIVTHLRVNDPYVVPILFGVVLWLGLYLRDPRVRELAPWRKPLAR